MQDPIVCRCERVRLSAIIDSLEQFHAKSSQEIKMLTRAGMGLCGGRTCSGLLTRVICARTGWRPADVMPTRRRPPVRPTLLSDVTPDAAPEGKSHRATPEQGDA